VAVALTATTVGVAVVEAERSLKEGGREFSISFPWVFRSEAEAESADGDNVDTEADANADADPVPPGMIIDVVTDGEEEGKVVDGTGAGAKTGLPPSPSPSPNCLSA
jgi:hypothetical protein